MAATPLRADDPKLGEFIEAVQLDDERLAHFDVILLGFPHDEGVRRNGGRVGASGAPQCVFDFARRLGTAANPEFLDGADLTALVKIGHAGLIGAGLPLDAAHALLTRAVARVCAAGAVPFVVGGGNDQSYANAAGWLTAHRPAAADHTRRRLTVVNVDAHLDVRPLLDDGRLAHSGSPFRQLLDDARFSLPDGDAFAVFAAQGHQCSAQHAAWLLERGGAIHWLSRLRCPAAATDRDTRFAVPGVSTAVGDAFERLVLGPSQRLFLSFDLDAVVGSDAPGVSCPSTVGLSAAEALDICFRAGYSGRTDLVDVSECNPAVENYRTPRLVALMFYYFVLGLAHRRHASS